MPGARLGGDGVLWGRMLRGALEKGEPRTGLCDPRRLPRPICLPCTVGANLALRRPPGSTCREHGELWGFRCVRGWDLGLGVTTQAVLPSPSQGKGTSTNLPFSLTVENELLNKLSIPAHFAALNGDTLNINLKTGMEVRVSGLGGCGGWESPGHLLECLFASSSSGCFPRLTPSQSCSKA